MTQYVEGVAIAIMGTTMENEDELARRIREAMEEALNKAVAEGVNDPIEQRYRMLAARNIAKRAWMDEHATTS